MFFINPISIYGAVLLLLGGLLLIWRSLAKSPEYRTTADLSVKTLVVVGLVWIVLGTATGLAA